MLRASSGASSTTGCSGNIAAQLLESLPATRGILELARVLELSLPLAAEAGEKIGGILGLSSAGEVAETPGLRTGVKGPGQPG